MMKGKFQTGAGGTFNGLVNATREGRVKWRIRLGHFVTDVPAGGSRLRTICIVDNRFTTARVILPDNSHWSRWQVETFFEGDLDLAREAILLGGLEENDGTEIQEG